MFEIIEVFCSWCREKINIHTTEKSPPLFKQGEVWWCSLGMNVGQELYGKGEKFRRLVLVLKKFSRNTFLCLPLTSREKCGTYFVEINLSGVQRWPILSQARTLDARRLESCIGIVGETKITQIRAQFTKLISS